MSSYMREGIEMVEFAPHQFINRPAGEAFGLVVRIPNPDDRPARKPSTDGAVIHT